MGDVRTWVDLKASSTHPDLIKRIIVLHLFNIMIFNSTHVSAHASSLAKGGDPLLYSFRTEKKSGPSPLASEDDVHIITHSLQTDILFLR